MTALLAPAFAPAPSVYDIETFLDTVTVTDLAVAAAASLDEVVGEWKRFERMDLAVEAPTYRRDDGFALVTVGLVLHVESGMPTLTTARLSVGLISDRLVLLSAEHQEVYPDDGTRIRPTFAATATAFATDIAALGADEIALRASPGIYALVEWTEVDSARLRPDAATHRVSDAVATMRATLEVEGPAELGLVRHVIVTVHDCTAPHGRVSIDLA